MVLREFDPQKETVELVTHEYRHGELRSGMSGQKIKSRKRGMTIALGEAGAPNQQTPKANWEHLRHAKAKERPSQPQVRRCHPNPEAPANRSSLTRA